MKTFILLVFVCSASAHATSPCKGKAIKAAMSKYLESGVIQGDDPVPRYRLIKTTKTSVSHSVTIDGGNDEGESWAITYRVKTKPAPLCKVTAVSKVGNR